MTLKQSTRRILKTARKTRQWFHRNYPNPLARKNARIAEAQYLRGRHQTHY